MFIFKKTYNKLLYLFVLGLLFTLVYISDRDTCEVFSSSSGALCSSQYSTGTLPDQKLENLVQHDIILKDISNWAVSPISNAIDHGLTTPKVLNNFKKNITREEFCELAVKLYEAVSKKSSQPALMNPFTDTYNNEISKAFNLGIVSGVSKNTFAPKLPVSREEISVMIFNTLKASLNNFSLDTSGVPAFKDEASISSWALKAAKHLNKQGIINGIGGNTMDPKRKTTREQAIAMVEKAYEKYHNYEGIRTPIPTFTILPSTSPVPIQQNFKGLLVSGMYVSIGDSESDVLHKFGSPHRQDVSEYGFVWYIYNHDAGNYFQIGLQNSKVVGLYSNAASLKYRNAVSVGMKKSDVDKLFGNPVSKILKGNTNFLIDNGNERETFLIDQTYITVFYDIYKDNSVTSIQVIEKSTEESLKSFYGPASDSLKYCFEREVFDLTNSIRVRMGKTTFQWNETAAKTARAHSKDMATRNFFDHTNPDGNSPFDRMKASGISYSMAAENIAAGQTSAIFAHEGWMNSSGHRSNILGDFQYLGVGVYMGGGKHVYYTQNFFTPFE